MNFEPRSSGQAALGLDDDELAFYDAVAANLGTLFDQAVLSGLIHDVVQTIKRNLKVDWTAPHRDDVKAGVRSAVRRVLRRKGVEGGGSGAVHCRRDAAGRAKLP